MRSRMSLLKLKNGSMSLIAISMKPGIILPLPSPNSVKPSSSFVVKTCSETTLDLLKTKRERDNLRCELVLARKVIRKLIAGRNKLRYELTEAKIGFEWFLSLYYEAEERIRFAKQQIERLEQQIERLETVNKLLAKFATDDV